MKSAFAGVVAVEFNLRYPGQQYDAETGLYYNHHRTYDPYLTVGYTQADPLGLDAGWNRFGYVGKNAFSYSDPQGRQAQAIAVCFVWPVGTAICGATAAAVAWGVWSTTHPIAQPNAGPLVFSRPILGSKPKNCPSGTLPIDQFPGLDHDSVHGIKGGVNAGPQDWTGISPDGDVITGNSNGNAVNHGPYTDYLP